QSSQTTDPTQGGRARYRFTISQAGTYTVKARLNAPSGASNSLFINIDSEPTTSNIWHMLVTSGTEERIASWGGSTEGSNPANTFTLSAGEHTLIVRGREGNLQLDNFTIVPQVVAAVADTTPPSTPSGLSGSVVSSSQINLSWGASSDNVGVAAYKLYRNSSSAITISSGTTYSDTGLTPSTAYSYVVYAVDAANNTSGQSNILTKTTPAPADTTAPTVPTNLVATVVSSARINLTWSASTDAVGVVNYKVYRNGILANTVTTGTSFADTTLSPVTTYTYTVTASDVAGNTSNQSVSAQGKTLALPDTTPPLISSVSSNTITSNSANISWITNEVADTQVEYGLTTGYGSLTALQTTRSTTHSASLIGLNSSTIYHYRVRSKDAQANSAISADQTFTTAAPPVTADRTPPTIGIPVASNITASGVTISWPTNELVTGRVDFGPSTSYGQNTVLSTLTSTPSASLINLVRKTTYHYKITATDSSGNSASSGDFTFTTQSRLSKPTPVTNVSASYGSVILNWTNPGYEYASSVVVTRRTDAFSQSANTSVVATLSGSATTWRDTNTVDGINYFYAIFVIDDLGVVSDPAFIAYTPTPPTTSGGGGSGGGGGGGVSTGGGGGGSTTGGGGGTNPGAGGTVFPPPTSGGTTPTTSSVVEVRTTTNLNIRTSPSLSGTIATKAPLYTTLVVTGPAVSANGYNWLPVKFANGTTGWAADAYLVKVTSSVTSYTPVTTTSSRYQTTLSVNVRNAPGLQGKILITAVPGSMVTVTGVAVQASGYTWLPVKFDNGLTGWAVSIYLTPVSSGTTVPVVIPVSTKTTVIFKAEDRIKTTTIVNVRSLPGTSNSIRGKTTTNASGTVLSGPVSANGYSWYQVKMDGGLSGWMVGEYLVK
ncbi:MAG: SH3 domain-containing protein, partial [Candidatus Paceibacterota bacterium]